MHNLSQARTEKWSHGWGSFCCIQFVITKGTVNNTDSSMKTGLLCALSEPVKLIRSYFDCTFTVTGGYSGYWFCSTVVTVKLD